SHHASRDTPFDRPSLHAGKRLADVKAERGVERERAIMKRRLYQSDSRSAAFVRTIHHGLHQLAANPEILRAWIDGDRPNRTNRRTLIQAIAPNNLPIDLRHNAVEIGLGKHHRKHSGTGLRPGKIARETVGRINRGKGVVANPPANSD